MPTSPHLPFPSEHSPWLHEVDRCASTNTWAIDHAALEHGDVVFTRQQTAGRGQNGRTWYAPPGVLTASLILDCLSTSRLPGLSLAAGLAVILAVEELMPSLQNVLRLKWPNDVLIGRRKLAGILCETTSRSSKDQTRVVVGVGLNRAVDFTQAELETGLGAVTTSRAISLHEVALAPDEMLLLARLRHHLLAVSQNFADLADLNSRQANNETESSLSEFLPELRRRDALLGKSITLQRGKETLVGQATGIDAGGRLLIQLPDRQVQVTSGHVLW